MKTITILALLLLQTACTTSKPNIPASVSELTIHSNGSRMPGHIYQAAGNGPHPTVVMLHGYPGNEKNLDIAQSLRKAGWNALFFHYRGSWGSEGEFSFLNSEQDVQAVINYIQQPNTAKKLKINPQKISLVGHSMGGHMAVAGILDNPSIKCAVAHDGANMGAKGKGLFSDAQSAKLWSNYSDTLFMLNGWSGGKAIAEVKQHGLRLDLVNRASAIKNRPIHLIAANTTVIPIDLHITPLLKALKQHTDHASYELIEDDHSFSNSRDKLTHSTLQFLKKNCQ